MITKQNKPVVIWLCIVALLVFAMVFIGGITRLTDSGLSMVEWRPLLGAIPPLNDEQWLEVFTRYQQFPEYKLVNHQMSLSEFKYIFFWEYFHRLMGRLVGIVFFFPFLYFYLKKTIRGKFAFKVSIAFILGGLQGLMGWYMVKSGLVDIPDVSHFRLAAHLSLAFLIIGYIYWLLMELIYPKREANVHKTATHKCLKIFLGVLCLQIVYGAFVAGLDGGLTHNTFPKMGRNWIPWESFSEGSFFHSILENHVGVQFTHRSIAYILTILGFVLLYLSRSVAGRIQRRSIYSIFVMLLVQFALGVMTLVMYVPVSVASAHQVGACILMLLTIRAVYLNGVKAV